MRQLNLPEGRIVSGYIDEFKSTLDLATEYSCSPSAISRCLKRNGVVFRKPSENKKPKWTALSREKARKSHTKIYIDKSELEYLYSIKRLSIEAMGVYFKCGASTVRQNLIRYEISIRTPGESNLGRVCSDQTKIKISASNNKRNLTREYLIDRYVNKLLSVTAIGRERGCSHKIITHWLKRYEIPIRLATHKPKKELISCSRRGKNGWHHTEETRRKMSEAAKGEKNHNWRNGSRNEKYCFKFNHAMKERIRDAFGRKCFLCGGVSTDGRALDVHHCDYNKGQGCGHEWNLIPLCNKCHGKTNANRHYYFNLLSGYWVAKYIKMGGWADYGF